MNGFCGFPEQNNPYFRRKVDPEPESGVDVVPSCRAKAFTLEKVPNLTKAIKSEFTANMSALNLTFRCGMRAEITIQDGKLHMTAVRKMGGKPVSGLMTGAQIDQLDEVIAPKVARANNIIAFNRVVERSSDSFSE